LKERNRVLFQSCVKALKNKQKERSVICANEIAQVKRLTTFLYHVELSIERVILRLETIKELSNIIIDLKPALKMLHGVSRQLYDFLPDVSSEIGEINDVISETIYSTKITTDEKIIPVGKTTTGGEEILKEVSSFLEERLTEKFPEPPETIKEAQEEMPVKQMVALAATCAQSVVQENLENGETGFKKFFSDEKTEIEGVSLKVENSSLEDMLLKYIVNNKGEIDMIKCSIELETSYSEIEKALKNLGTIGKIKIEAEK
jgi:division protein CdvB (Snf7/Vps24/ESCRT-III family)